MTESMQFTMYPDDGFLDSITDRVIKHIKSNQEGTGRIISVTKTDGLSVSVTLEYTHDLSSSTPAVITIGQDSVRSSVSSVLGGYRRDIPIKVSLDIYEAVLGSSASSIPDESLRVIAEIAIFGTVLNPTD